MSGFVTEKNIYINPPLEGYARPISEKLFKIVILYKIINAFVKLEYDLVDSPSSFRSCDNSTYVSNFTSLALNECHYE